MNMIADGTIAHDPASSGLSAAQAAAMARVGQMLGHLNAAVAAAVETGLTVELIRASRHHSGARTWGDQLKPVVARADG
ncbi:MAG: hypothetical protein SFV21_12690 [Rhodospirillaceae bacterium]|nr:hypothetical protein [Rhodospirillaceae bacterium]